MMPSRSGPVKGETGQFNLGFMGKILTPSIRSIIQRIKDDKIQFIDLKFVDLFGSLQHLAIAADNVDEGDLVKGFSFDGSSIQGFQTISDSDLILRPDPASMFVDPFFEDPTLSFFCDIIVNIELLML